MQKVRLKRRAKRSNAKGEQVRSLVQYLTPDARTSLANLYQVPSAVVDAVIQLFPTGTRLALVAANLAEPDEGGVAGRQAIRLTPIAYDVIAYLAQLANSDPQFEDWTDKEELSGKPPSGNQR